MNSIQAQTLKKNERLSAKKEIDALFESGKSFNVKSIKVIYLVKPGTEIPPCKVVFSVPKRNFKKAVDRNLVKRRMKEIYRKQKYTLYTHMEEHNSSLSLILLYTAKEIAPFKTLELDLHAALLKLSEKTGKH